jgi:hypothetical protein
MKREVHSFPAKGDAFHFETKTLFSPGFKAKFNLTGGADHTLPRKSVGRTGLEETRHRTMIQRISSRGGHLAVRRHFPFRNGEDHAPKSSVTNLIRAQAALEDTALGSSGGGWSFYLSPQNIM